MSDFRKGDRVSWHSHGSTAHGEVLRKITEDTELAGRTVRASAAPSERPTERARLATTCMPS